MRPDDAQVSVQTGREEWREGRRARRVARGKIKGGREVRIRLSQRMLELLSDFLARIMEHSLKKAFARDRDTPVFPFFSSASPLTHPLLLARTRYTCSLLFFRDFSFVLSNKNSKLFADERG